MKIEWKFDAEDLAAVSELARRMQNNPFVVRRRRRNIEEIRSDIDIPRFWKVLACCLLTTQQRSGPDGKVARFIASNPRFLRYAVVEAANDRPSWLLRELSGSGLRRTNIISKELNANFVILERGWQESIRRQVRRLLKPVEPAVEREVAEFIQATFDGFGPKQSRNLLQALGLTRYEIPIDGRISRWLNARGFPIPLVPSALNDGRVYAVIMDGIALFCEECGLLPCEFDAMVFASFDGDKWTDEAVARTAW